MLSRVSAGASTLLSSSMPHLASHEVSLRSGQDVSPQFIQMVQVCPHDRKERPYALGGQARMEKIALDAEGFQSLGLIPNQASGNRSAIHIKGRHIGDTSPAAFGNVMG